MPFRTAADPVPDHRRPWLGAGVALALLAGALLAMLLPELPSLSAIGILLVLAMAGMYWSKLRLLAFVIFGCGWLCLHASLGMQARLPTSLEGIDLTLEGRIEGLPHAEGRRQRFDFIVEHGDAEASVLNGRRVRLSWYQPAPVVDAGSRWRFVVRLQRPHGGRNPGGFDFERYALQRGLVATGYVREDIVPGEPEGSGVDAWREWLATGIDVSVDGGAGRFLRGIGIADTRGLDDADWETLRATGTSHLLAISGLHLGLLAGLAALLARLFYRILPRLGLRLPLPQGAALAALSAAAGYAALAGFGLPTRRALLMLACVLLARLLRRNSGIAHGLSVALIVILLLDPLAILGAGFWLSFVGVAWLLWTLPGSAAASVQGARQRSRAWLREALLAQGVLSLGLLPLSLAFFGKASLLSLPVNLVAVPLLTFVILPLTLLGIGLLLLGLPAEWLLRAAEAGMHWLWWLLERAAELPVSQLTLPTPSLHALLLAAMAMLWLLSPRGVPGKGLALLLLLPMFEPRLETPGSGQLEVTVFDVGQGLAILLRTEHHALLYDAGPAPPGALDRGAAVVVPALLELGVQRLDRLIVSHGDNDHAGGAAAVIRGMHPVETLVGESIAIPDAKHCEAGTEWRWDAVEFRLLHPPAHFPSLGNQSSCVLLVTAAGQRLLLPGDIDSLIEARLLRENPSLGRVDALLVPHHGSNGSSSEAFIEVLQPSVALFSAGHRNRFDHPRSAVLDRYRALGSELRNTAGEGALRFRMGVGVKDLVVIAEREQHPHFWSESLEKPR